MTLDFVLVLGALLLVAVYLSWRAGRLDRLHARVDMARAALDAALLRRGAVALELASSGLLDPATSLLLAEAAPRVPALDRAREAAESDLTRALRAAFTQPGFLAVLGPEAAVGGPAGDGSAADGAAGDGAAIGPVAKDGAAELLAEVETVAHQVYLARKFYNDAVAATQEARHRPLARLLRLAGNAPAPEFFEIDDSLSSPDGGTAPPR